MKTLIFTVMALLFVGTASVFGQKEMKDEGKKSEHAFAIKELKLFHDVLHPLVHDALPKGDFGRIRSNLEKLLKKATAIDKAKLPKDLAGRKAEFKTKSGELVTLLTEMVSMKDKVDDDTLEKMFNEMHERFEQLAEIVK